jgi:hypothetical protein
MGSCEVFAQASFEHNPPDLCYWLARIRDVSLEYLSKALGLTSKSAKNILIHPDTNNVILWVFSERIILYS